MISSTMWLFENKLYYKHCQH